MQLKWYKINNYGHIAQNIFAIGAHPATSTIGVTGKEREKKSFDRKLNANFGKVTTNMRNFPSMEFTRVTQ